MNILTCFKISECLDAVTDNEWNHCLDDTDIPCFLESAPGIYDEAALESALQIKDQAEEAGIPANLTAFTLGQELPDTLSSRLFGVRYDRVVHMKYDLDIRFRPDTVSDIIARFIEENKGYDIVLMGQQSSPGENARTHILTAHKLGVPCVLNVVDIGVGNGYVSVRSIADGGFLEQKVKTPVILGIGDAVHPYLRVATLRERLAASKKKAEIYGAYETDKSGPSPMSGMYREVRTRKCEWVEGDSAKEKMQALYDQVIRRIEEETRV